MHELSLATEIIELIRPGIPEGECLKAVGLIVGPLAGVCTDSLEFCFDELIRVEGYPGAKLKMETPPAFFKCHACAREYEARSVEVLCPDCGSMTRSMLSGTEFSIQYIEV